MNQNQPIMCAPPPEGVMNSKKDAASEMSAEGSAVHYKGLEEPGISLWTLLVGIVALLATAYFIYKFAPVFERGRILAPF
jgi:hypothetical protein